MDELVSLTAEDVVEVTPDDLGLDELPDVELPEGDENEIIASRNLPGGSYATDPSVAAVTRRESDAGRTYSRFFGQVTHLKNGRTGRIGFGFSSQRMNKVVDGVETDQADLMSGLYAQTKKIYEELTGAKATKLSELEGLFTEHSVGLRVAPGRDGGDPLVVAVFKLRE